MFFAAKKSIVISASLLAFASLTVLASGCSDDKSPPDDGKDGKAFAIAQKACASDEEAQAFRRCALGLLGSSGLTSVERQSLASCEFAKAVPESSSEDLFEIARATVKAHCL